MLQVFLALAPADALADDTAFENVTAISRLASSENGGFVLSGNDPVQDTFDRTFEPGEIFASAEDGESLFERNSVSAAANTPARTGAFARFYRTRAPPLSSIS